MARVVVAVRDPWPPAAGGIDRLRAAGIEVVDLAEPGVEPAPAVATAVTAAQDVNRVWLTAHRLARPFVTWKVGMTIDGRVAAADGSRGGSPRRRPGKTCTGCEPRWTP